MVESHRRKGARQRRRLCDGRSDQERNKVCFSLNTPPIIMRIESLNSSAAVCCKSSYRALLRYEDSWSGESCIPQWPLSCRRTSDKRSPNCNELPHNPTSVGLPVCVP